MPGTELTEIELSSVCVRPNEEPLINSESNLPEEVSKHVYSYLYCYNFKNKSICARLYFISFLFLLLLDKLLSYRYYSFSLKRLLNFKLKGLPPSFLLH